MVERYTLAKFYRLPPKFSLDLTYWNIEILAGAPICMLAIAFWMLGNHQMFNNQEIAFTNKIDDVLPSFHLIGKTFSSAFSYKLTRAEGTLFVAFIIFLIIFATRVMINSFKSIREAISGRENLDLDLISVPNYFDCLREQDLEELVDEEQTFIYEFGI